MRATIRTALADYLALTLLGSVFFPVFIFAICLLFEVGELRWPLALAGVVFAPLVCWPLLNGKRLRAKLFAAVTLLLFIAASATFCHLIYDQSDDGLVYHCDAILSLLRGTNPVYNDMEGRFPLWTNHYPKALWYFAAIITHATGDFQLGKLFNFLLGGSVFFYALSYGKRREYTSPLIALAFAFSPVALNQLFSFYVDGALCSLFSLALLSALALLFRPRLIDRLVFILAACLLINVKFTGVAYVFVIMAISAMVDVYRCVTTKDFSRAKAFIYDAIIIALAGLILIGVNPYITNTLIEGNPMYPLFGPYKIDVVSSQTPALFKQQDYSGPHRLIESLFSTSENFCHGTTCDPAIKLPFTFTRAEAALFANVDVRIGAWGVLFSGLLVLGIALYICAAGWRDAESTSALLMIAATLLINPHAWWARYAPQAALLPLFLAWPALSRARALRTGALFLYALFVVNALCIVVPHSLYFYDKTQRLRSQIAHILTTCGTGNYIIRGTAFHYEQFVNKLGIELSYGEDTGSKDGLPLGEGYVQKAGCNIPAP